MPARDPGRRAAVGAPCREWANAAVVLDHRTPGRGRARKQPPHRGEEIIDLCFVGAGRRRIALKRDVGRADEHETIAEGQHEHRPAILRLGIHPVHPQPRAERRMIDEEMAPLRPTDQRRTPGPPVHREERSERPIDPGAGGVDDGPRGEMEHAGGARYPSRGGQRRDSQSPVRSEVGRVPAADFKGDIPLRGDRPGVDEKLDSEAFREAHLGVVIHPRERKATGVDRRHPRRCRGHQAPPGPEGAGREEVVEPEPAGDRDPSPTARPRPAPGKRLAAEDPGRGGQEPAEPTAHRDDEPEGADQVGRELEEAVALGQTFAHQRQLSVFKVPQSPVDQPRRPSGRPRSDVVGVDDDDGAAVENELPGQRRPVDPRPEDDDIDGGRERIPAGGRVDAHRSISLWHLPGVPSPPVCGDVLLLRRRAAAA